MERKKAYTNKPTRRRCAPNTEWRKDDKETTKKGSIEKKNYTHNISSHLAKDHTLALLCEQEYARATIPKSWLNLFNDAVFIVVVVVEFLCFCYFDFSFTHTQQAI